MKKIELNGKEENKNIKKSSLTLPTINSPSKKKSEIKIDLKNENIFYLSLSLLLFFNILHYVFFVSSSMATDEGYGHCAQYEMFDRQVCTVVT